jgi:purine-nucleoside phosphorylase
MLDQIQTQEPVLKQAPTKSASSDMLEQIRTTTEFIKSKVPFTPEVGIILGTGLGGLVKEIEIKYSLPYETIPNFPVSTVEGHSGKLIFGVLGGKNVVAMQGRFHFYEGYDMKQVTFPVRVMKFLGVKNLFVSNASGGVNPDFEIGDLMILDDHINLFPTNPLIGKNESSLGPRFPDMSETYDHKLVAKAKEIAAKNNIRVVTGTYAGLTGPCLETPAEYRYIRNIGADAVGMSTVPEVMVARHMGIPCFAISIITDLGVPGKIVKVTHEDVQDVASKAEPKMTLIMRELVSGLEATA